MKYVPAVGRTTLAADTPSPLVLTTPVGLMLRMGLLAALYTVICMSRLERVQLAVVQGTTTCRQQAATIQLLYTVVVCSYDVRLCLFSDCEQSMLLGGSG
jgi:hypothetical protein